MSRHSRRNQRFQKEHQSSASIHGCENDNAMQNSPDDLLSTQENSLLPIDADSNHDFEFGDGIGTILSECQSPLSLFSEQQTVQQLTLSIQLNAEAPEDNSLDDELPRRELFNVLGEIKQLLDDRSNILKTIPCDVSEDAPSILHSSIQPELPSDGHKISRDINKT